jgi:hypothetical protein
MAEKTIDELAKENAILISKKSDVFYEEKGHLKSSLQYMVEENGTWKFKGNVPMATAIRIKNVLAKDNAKMSKAVSKLNSPRADKNKRIVIFGVAIASAVGFYFLYRHNKKKKEERIVQNSSPPSVFDAVIPKRPKKVIKKMIIEEFEKNEEGGSIEGPELSEDT